MMSSVELTRNPHKCGIVPPVWLPSSEPNAEDEIGLIAAHDQ